MNRRTTALIAAAVLGSVALVSGCSDEGKPVNFDNPGASRTPAPKGSGAADPGQDKARDEKVSEVAAKTLLPTGPKAQFTTQNTLDDGTKIGVTTLHGKKSGFTGKVWVWAPKQYFDPKYAASGFPVLIALPGGNGYPKNYWMGTDLKLQSSITQWSKEGKSVPFVVVMPVLNPDAKYYYDGSDIPGHPKMGTWMTEDVPDFVKANFRTFKSRDGWAFMGSSSGGFVGLKSVLKRPDQFKAVIASGPDTVPDSPLWAGHEAEKQANNPEKLAQDLIDKKGPEVDLAFQIGTKEGGMASLNAFIAKYGKGPVKTHLQVIQGGKHNAHTYIKGMGDGTMQWISSRLQAPIPSS
ncbi:alpha/beta hydrolase-fold protein [Streptomyces sp. NPDC023838]|uniref:alpha/beta hydrolase n=1 Tax=Streptomyces sp. NPDC023838 TaxID=3154325 RepID=UPI0033CD2E66